MKQIASLLMASVCTLALLTPAVAAETRWGWSDLDRDVSLVTRIEGFPAMANIGQFAGAAIGKATVVSVNLDPKTIKAPGILAGVWPKFKDALDAVRRIVVGDPTLKASLEAGGISPDRLVGVGETADG